VAKSNALKWGIRELERSTRGNNTNKKKNSDCILTSWNLTKFKVQQHDYFNYTKLRNCFIDWNYMEGRGTFG